MDQPPSDYENDLPESSGSKVDQFFWWGYKFLPKWLLPGSDFAESVMDIVFINCPWCIFMRGAFLGLIAGWLAGIIATGFLVWLF